VVQGGLRAVHAGGSRSRQRRGTSLWGAGSYSYDAMGNMLTSTLGTTVFAEWVEVGFPEMPE
jgi:hypothetical protein